MRLGDDLHFERWEVQGSDGRKRPIAISTSVLVESDGSAHVLALMHDLSHREAYQAEARRGRKDDLTGVRNRRGFEEDAGSLVDLTRRHGQPVTVAFLDANRFKQFNDTRGHAEGDRALRAIGRELQAAVRSLDVVGRLGGDEFALLLPGMAANFAEQFFARLLGRLTDLSERSEWGLGFSIGAVTYVDRVPALMDALKHADRLMYRAKAAGDTKVAWEGA